MVELPQEMRALLVERLDDFISDLTDTSDPESIALSIVRTIEAIADEVEYEKAEEVISRLEASGELEGTLVEVLEEHLSSDDEFDFMGEDLVSLIEKICEIEWADAEEGDDNDIDDFFEDDEVDEDY